MFRYHYNKNTNLRFDRITGTVCRPIIKKVEAEHKISIIEKNRGLGKNHNTKIIVKPKTLDEITDFDFPMDSLK